MSDQMASPVVEAIPSQGANGRPADPDPTADGARQTDFISFAIGDEQYGVDIMAVREIKGWNPITHLPKQPDHMRGVLNLRGVMVPIVDLRCRLGEGLTETTPMHVVIVVQIGAQAVGLLADRVLDIVSVDSKQVQPVPRISRAGRRNYLSGLVTVDGQMIALLDLPQLLAEDVADETSAVA